LSGLGDRKHLLSPAIDLYTHIADIANLLEYNDIEDAVLVGHSYGGMVITGVADSLPGRIQQLVYLDAAHPRDGEAMVDNVSSGLLDILRQEVRIEDGVELVMFPDSPLLAAMGVTDPDDYRWLVSKVTPHPWRCFTQPLNLRDEQAVRRIHRTSINCSATLKVLSGEKLARRTSDASRAYEISAGHDVMITEPDCVARLLVEGLER
jgi:pimeloyl-ACP methyl ester carboxylesterase